MRSKQIKIPVPFGHLFAQCWGDPDKSPIIAIHGWLDNSASFELLAEHLVNDFYVVAVDLAGHGHSSHRGESSYGYHFHDWVLDLEWVVRHLDFDEYFLMGHSMGSGISSLFISVTERKPKYFIGLDGYAPFVAHEDAFHVNFKAFFDKTLHSRHKDPAQNKLTLESAIRRRKQASIRVPERALELICKRQLLKDQWTHDERLKLPSSFYMSPKQLMSVFSQINVPILLVLGQESPFSAMIERGLKLLDHNPKLTIRRFAAEHYPHCDFPKEVAGEILNLLS